MVGVVVVISVAIPVLTLAMIPVLGLCYYYANRYLQVRWLLRARLLNPCVPRRVLCSRGLVICLLVWIRVETHFVCCSLLPLHGGVRHPLLCFEALAFFVRRAGVA